MITYHRKRLMIPTQHEMETFVNAGYTAADIAVFNGWSVSKTRYWLKKYDLTASKEKSSIGAKSLRAILSQAFKGYVIIPEYHIVSRLRVDFYVPGLCTAFEVDGVQHEEVVGLFHQGSQAEFNKAKQRDEDKEQWCIDNDVLLIRVTQSQVVEAIRSPQKAAQLIQLFRDKIAEVSPTGPESRKKEVTPASERYNQYREDMKKLGKKKRKEAYRRAKAMKDKLKKLQ